MQNLGYGFPRRHLSGISVNKEGIGSQHTGLAGASYIFSRASQSYMIFLLNSRKFITSNLMPSGSSKNVA